MERQTKEEKQAGPMFADQEPDKIENRNSHFRCRLCGHNTEQSYCFLAPVGSSADGWFPATCPNCKAEYDVGDVGSGFVGIRLKAQKLKPTEHPKCLSCLAGMKYTGQDYTDRANINRTFTCRDCGEPHTARKIGRGIKWLRQTKMVPLLDEPAKPDATAQAIAAGCVMLKAVNEMTTYFGHQHHKDCPADKRASNRCKCWVRKITRASRIFERATKGMK